MTRPQIIRAETRKLTPRRLKDSIDLQDLNQPSAKDHSRHRLHPSPLGQGSIAPHQASTLKHVAEEQNADQIQRSPRVSGEWINGENDLLDRPVESSESDVKTVANGQQQQSQNEQSAQQGGAAAEDSDLADTEGDDGLDDDMMDKMSSSPSIDDGEYHLPPEWPQRVDSLTSSSSSQSSLAFSDINSSSPPIRLPLFSKSSGQEERDRGEEEAAEMVSLSEDHHHLQGGYSGARGRSGRDDWDETSVETSCRLGHSLHKCYLPRYREGDADPSYDGDGGRGGSERQGISPIHSLEGSILDNNLDHGFVSSGSSSMVTFESRDGFGEDDDVDDISFSDDPRFTDSGWGGECLRETEDIDFEFVYALHTFVATVEGQANATKGDTMVLLDDSNSYWWLVRVVKDSSIGYLPAEHIETPTERLARLNKHRNIDLSATMLGDNPEKTKNPLKKAIRRRNAKTVQFAAPTYFEASDIDYSSSEEEGEEDYPANEEEEAEKKDVHQADHDEITEVEPPQVKDSKPESPEPSAASRENKDTEKKVSVENPRASDEISDKSSDGTLKSRMGTVRNTDSFFKDDNVETRKITLTPNLLRDDSSTSTVRSNDSRELKSRGSMDTDKVAPLSGHSREDKKRKDKKPGMLSGFFKRKEKKRYPDEESEDNLNEKQSGELSRDSPSFGKTSEDSTRLEAQPQPLQVQPLRQMSKLKKQPPSDQPSAVDREPSQPSLVREPTLQQVKPLESQGPSPGTHSGSSASTMRLVDPEVKQNSEYRPPQPKVVSSEPVRAERAEGGDTRKESHTTSSVFAPIANIIRSSHSSSPKPEKVRKASTRVALDDFDSSPDTETPPNKNPFASDPDNQTPKFRTERLSESPVQLTHADAAPSQPPGLLIDTSSQETSSSPTSLPSSSPETTDTHDNRGLKGYEDTPNSTADSISVTPTWSDASLRTYFEDSSDIRDLLIVVHDTSGVVPVGPDHPLIRGIFQEEKTKLTEMGNRLDDLLGGLLSTKMRVAAR